MRNVLLIDLLLANILDNFIVVLTMIVRIKNVHDVSCSSFWIFFQVANLTREIKRQENAIMKLISLVKPELQRFPVQTQVSVFLR